MSVRSPSPFRVIIVSSGPALAAPAVADIASALPNAELVGVTVGSCAGQSVTHLDRFIALEDPLFEAADTMGIARAVALATSSVDRDAPVMCASGDRLSDDSLAEALAKLLSRPVRERVDPLCITPAAEVGTVLYRSRPSAPGGGTRSARLIERLSAWDLGLRGWELRGSAPCACAGAVALGP